MPSLVSFRVQHGSELACGRPIALMEAEHMVAINTYGTYIFGLDTVPAWANRTVAVGGVYIGHGLDHIGHNVHVGE